MEWISANEWTTNPDYQVPVNEQRALLEEVDAEFLAKVTEFFQRKGANERVAGKGRR